jgi:Arc/MetJ family transcription regulator
MASHMKTTVQIADALLAEAQAIAAREKTTLKALVNEGLRQVVESRARQQPFKLRDASFGPAAANPDLEHLKWEDIVDKAYEGRGG